MMGDPHLAIEIVALVLTAFGAILATLSGVLAWQYRTDRAEIAALKAKVQSLELHAGVDRAQREEIGRQIADVKGDYEKLDAKFDRMLVETTKIGSRLDVIMKRSTPYPWEQKAVKDQ